MLKERIPVVCAVRGRRREGRGERAGGQRRGPLPSFLLPRPRSAVGAAGTVPSCHRAAVPGSGCSLLTSSCAGASSPGRASSRPCG